MTLSGFESLTRHGSSSRHELSSRRVESSRVVESNRRVMGVAAAAVVVVVAVVVASRRGPRCALGYPRDSEAALKTCPACQLAWHDRCRTELDGAIYLQALEARTSRNCSRFANPHQPILKQPL